MFAPIRKAILVREPQVRESLVRESLVRESLLAPSSAGIPSRVWPEGIPPRLGARCESRTSVLTPIRTTAIGVIAGIMSAAAIPANAQEDKPVNGNDAPKNLIIEPTAMLPQVVASFGSAVADDWLYVAGGHVGKAHQHSRDNVTGDVYRLNLLDFETWEKLPGEIPLQSVALVSDGKRLIRIGGMEARNPAGEPEDMRSTAAVERFDPLTRSWTSLPDLPEPRSSHDAAVAGNTVYVVGGWTLTGHALDAQWLDTAHRMDLSSESPTWEPLPTPPFKRRAIAAAVAAGKLYAIGGIDDDDQTSSVVDVLDLAAGTWSKGPDVPSNGFGIAAFGVNDHVYASGMDGSIYRLNDAGARWDRVGTLAFPRFFHRLVAADDDHLLAVGGAVKAGHLRHIESVDLADAHPRTPRLASWRVPYPGDARNRQGVFLHDNAIYLFGGNNSLEQHDFESENFLTEGFRVHLGSLAISPVADFPVHRQSMQTLAAEGPDAVGYAVGGFGHDGQVARSHADVYRYKFNGDKWEHLSASLPSPRTQFGLVEHGGSLWIFGGLDYDPTRERDDHFRHVRDVLRCDVSNPDATFTVTEHELPRPRRAFGAALLGDRYYLVAGMRESFKTVEECDVFDFKTAAWDVIPSPSRPRISPELVALHGRLYLAGGSSPGDAGDIEPNASVEVYDPSTQKWSVLIDELPILPKHMRMAAFGNRLLIHSTHDERDHAITILLIDPRQTDMTDDALAEAAPHAFGGG